MPASRGRETPSPERNVVASSSSSLQYKEDVHVVLKMTYLKQDAVVGDVSPEVRDGVPAVSSAHLDLQHPIAVQIRANLTFYVESIEVATLFGFLDLLWPCRVVCRVVTFRKSNLIMLPLYVRLRLEIADL